MLGRAGAGGVFVAPVVEELGGLVLRPACPRPVGGRGAGVLGASRSRPAVRSLAARAGSGLAVAGPVSALAGEGPAVAFGGRVGRVMRAGRGG